MGCTGGGTIPGTGDSFPTGSLLCLNERQDDGGRVCQANRRTFTFKDSNDFLTCRGYQSCNNQWRVNNPGAVCCSGEQSCKSDARFELNNDGQSSCTSDACCDGDQACDDARFSGVNSMSCRGQDTCGGNGRFSLPRNLYCSSTSLVMSGGPYNNVCDNDSRFNYTAGGEHCVQCLGQNVCTDSRHTFNFASEVSVNCVGLSACSGNAKFFSTTTANSKWFAMGLLHVRAVMFLLRLEVEQTVVPTQKWS